LHGAVRGWDEKKTTGNWQYIGTSKSAETAPGNKPPTTPDVPFKTTFKNAERASFKLTAFSQIKMLLSKCIHLQQSLRIRKLIFFQVDYISPFSLRNVDI